MIQPIEPAQLAEAERQARDLAALRITATLDDDELERMENAARRLARARELARQDVALPVWGYILVISFFLAGIFVGKWLPWGFGLPL